MPETPIVLDTRPIGHNSFGTLPYLEIDEYDRLRSFYKFDWLTTYGYEEAYPGELYLGLYAIELKAGPAIVQPCVFDLQGQPVSNVLLWFSWPDAPALDSAAQPRYKETGVFGWTDATGSCSWAYGQESHIGPDGGPYTVWCNSGEGPLGTLVGSDAITNLGWWDEHITPNPWFRVMRKEGGPIPPVGDAGYLVDLDESGNVTKHIEWIKGAPSGPTERGSLGIMDENGTITHHMNWS